MSAMVLALTSRPRTQSKDAPEVLLVDDDLLIQRYTCDVLEEVGIVPRVATRLSDARRELEKKPPALILVDGLLPDGTGLKFIREVRAAGYTMPIIFLSAFFRDLETFRALRGPLGVSCILHKPISPQNLALRVRWALGNLTDGVENVAPVSVVAS